jgi:hypothetical protein
VGVSNHGIGDCNAGCPRVLPPAVQDSVVRDGTRVLNTAGYLVHFWSPMIFVSSRTPVILPVVSAKTLNPSSTAAGQCDAADVRKPGVD